MEFLTSIALLKDMKFGISQSVETLHIEAELACVQQKAAKLSAKVFGYFQKAACNCFGDFRK